MNIGLGSQTLPRLPFFSWSSLTGFLKGVAVGGLGIMRGRSGMTDDRPSHPSKGGASVKRKRRGQIFVLFLLHIQLPCMLFLVELRTFMIPSTENAVIQCPFHV